MTVCVFRGGLCTSILDKHSERDLDCSSSSKLLRIFRNLSPPLSHSSGRLRGVERSETERSGPERKDCEMKKHCFAWSRGRAMAMKVFGGVSILALAFAGMVAAEVSKPVKPALLEAYGKLPLSFEANDGQADPQVKFLSRGRGYTLFLTSTETVLVLREGASARNVGGGLPAAKRERGKALSGTVLR